MVVAAALAATADPAHDRDRFKQVYQDRFPELPLAEFVHGVYAVDARLREQWNEIQDFSPYEFALDEGAEEFAQPFSSGKAYTDCFGDDVAAIAPRYPYFDAAAAEVITLPLAINRCRLDHAEEALPWETGRIAALLAHLAYAARGQELNVELPQSTPALAAYESGRRMFFSKRGQLNFSCADCHVQAVGRRLREQTLTPLLGVVNRYPAYWLRWGSMGTLHQRFGGCMELARAAPLPAQSGAFRALEYFLAIMGSGLPIAGPSTQR